MKLTFIQMQHCRDMSADHAVRHEGGWRDAADAASCASFQPSPK